MQTKQREQVHNNGQEFIPLNSAFQVFFAAHFLADAVSLQCSNTGLNLVLIEQIRNTQPCECPQTITN
jgi:hypothetical protein